MHAGAAVGLGQCIGAVAHGVQPGGREQLEHERRVFLHGGKAAREQEAGEVDGGLVGRVELRRRGDGAQHAEIGGHGSGALEKTQGGGYPKRPNPGAGRLAGVFMDGPTRVLHGQGLRGADLRGRPVVTIRPRRWPATS